MSNQPVHIRGARKLALATALLVVVGGALTGCGSASSSSTGSSSAGTTTAAAGTTASSSGTPFRFLFICSLSGPLAAAGQAELHGLQAAQAYINSQGGILGHKVAITTMDDGGTGTKAVSVAQQALAGGTQYNVINGGCFGQDSIPLQAVFAKTPAIEFGSLPDNLVIPPKSPNSFNPTSSTSDPEVAMATAMKAHGITKIAIITGDDATGQIGAQELGAAAKKLGMTITATELIPDTSVDATSQMQAAAASHPQALAVNNYTPVIGPILKARAKLGVTLPLWGDSFFSAANLALISTPAERKGVVEEAFPFLVSGNAAEKTPTWHTFATYMAKYEPKPLISLYADVNLWDELMMARAAAVKAGTIDGSALPKALENISSASSIPGFIGPAHLYSPDNHTWAVTPADYVYVPAGTSPKGLIIPGS